MIGGAEARRAGPATVLVLGSRSSGKTAYARAVTDRARAAGLRVAGFLSEGEWEGGVKCRYFLRRLDPPGERTLLASAQPSPSLDERVGRFHMSSHVLSRANRALLDAWEADVICIDEVGPLELRGGGFAPALRALLRSYRGVLLLTARPSVGAPLLRALAGAGVEVVEPAGELEERDAGYELTVLKG